MNKHNSIQLSISKIVELSGIENYSNYQTIDYAIPINSDGSYPYNGKAVSLYLKNGDMIIVPHYNIMALAIEAIDEMIFNPSSFIKLSKSKIYELLLYKDLLESIYDKSDWMNIKNKNTLLYNLNTN